MVPGTMTTPWLPLQSRAQCTQRAQRPAPNASNEEQETLLLVLMQKGQNQAQLLTIWTPAAAVCLVPGRLLAAAGQNLRPGLQLLPLLPRSLLV
jgi:hypothetical protein